VIRIFIGYDPREPVAFHACVSSITRHASMPFSVTPLALNNLTGYKELHQDGSNQFIYSRFLVPALCDFQGWALYIDGDMIVTGDIAELWDMRDPLKAVQVVQHDYKTKAAKKYLGAKNEDYPRKNWSSVILWNCGHHQNRKLTVDHVQHATGAQLHRFQHLEDRFIGELPKEWNWLVGEYDKNPQAKLLHYTLGTPCFEEYAGCDHAEEWYQERQILNSCDNGVVDYE
jgi:lipopolysaccharide biosynthesis glycosyltransferase